MNRAPRLMAIRGFGQTVVPVSAPGGPGGGTRAAAGAEAHSELPDEVRAGSSGDPESRLATWAVSLARAGVDCLQLRDKLATDRQVYEGARAAVEALAAWWAAEGGGQAPGRAAEPARVLVNRRPDISSAAGASGVHLPAQGLPIGAVREAFGEEFVIGRSTHSLEEVEDAERRGADYVVFGPVFETPEKLRYGAPLGLEQLARAAVLGIPVLAIGGITEDRLEAVAQAGASGIAAIRLFADAARAAAVVGRATAVFHPIGAPAHA